MVCWYVVYYRRKGELCLVWIYDWHVPHHPLTVRNHLSPPSVGRFLAASFCGAVFQPQGTVFKGNIWAVLGEYTDLDNPKNDWLEPETHIKRKFASKSPFLVPLRFRGRMKIQQYHQLYMDCCLFSGQYDITRRYLGNTCGRVPGIQILPNRAPKGWDDIASFFHCQRLALQKSLHCCCSAANLGFQPINSTELAEAQLPWRVPQAQLPWVSWSGIITSPFTSLCPGLE